MQGLPGPKGAKGDIGLRGEKGANGSRGLPGPRVGLNIFLQNCIYNYNNIFQQL